MSLFGKTTTGIDVSADGSKMVVHKITKGQKASEAHLIPWTPGPRTRWQKIKRALI